MFCTVLCIMLLGVIWCLLHFVLVHMFWGVLGCWFWLCGCGGAATVLVVMYVCGCAGVLTQCCAWFFV